METNKSFKGDRKSGSKFGAKKGAKPRSKFAPKSRGKFESKAKTEMPSERPAKTTYKKYKDEAPASVRLNKFIADTGHCSRRKADELIDEGRVTVNGRKVFELGVKVNPNKDQVSIDKKLLKSTATKNFVYFIMNKPTQVLTSMSDPSGRPTVADYFQKLKHNQRLFPVGRLDWDSEGLLIMTNDGDYSQRVTHPKEEIPKTYYVKIDQDLSDGKKQKLLSGVTIVGGKVRASEIYRLKKNDKDQKTFWFAITITEGKNRQVRRMFEKLEIDVVKLRRVSIGNLKLGKLKPGHILQMQSHMAFKVFEKPKTIVDKSKSESSVAVRKRIY